MYCSDLAWVKIWRLIDHCPKEVGWLGIVSRMGDNYLIEDIYVPDQEVTGSETLIPPEAMAELCETLMTQGIDISKLRYWGHSHVNMGVTPSATDEDQVAEYIEHVDWFIRGIHNKRADSKVDVYDVEKNLIFQKCDFSRLPPVIPEETIDQFLKEVDRTVLPQQANILPYTYQGGYQGGHQGGYKPGQRWNGREWVDIDPFQGRVLAHPASQKSETEKDEMAAIGGNLTTRLLWAAALDQDEMEEFLSNPFGF